MEGSFWLKRYVGGLPHFAEVAVQAEPAERDEVTVSQDVYEWRKDLYGPNAASGGPDDESFVEAAAEGVRYALRHRPGDSLPGILVNVTKIRDSPMDTAPAHVKFAAVEATRQALNVELTQQPHIDRTGVIFPE